MAVSPSNNGTAHTIIPCQAQSFIRWLFHKYVIYRGGVNGWHMSFTGSSHCSSFSPSPFIISLSSPFLSPPQFLPWMGWGNMAWCFQWCSGLAMLKHLPWYLYQSYRSTQPGQPSTGRHNEYWQWFQPLLEKKAFCILLPGLLAYWPSWSKALAVKWAGNPANVGCILA